MAAERVPMTPEGHARLRVELDHLRKVEFPKVVQDIATARDHGDLSENAEYHAAKDRQGMLHARAKFVEDMLSRAEVIDPSKLSGDRVKFGAKVTLLNIDTDEEATYMIVGSDESDVKLMRISVSSPIARGLIGKEVGDEVTIKLPAGTKVFEIQDVQYG
jgi:transcription elongation factor GreA